MSVRSLRTVAALGALVALCLWNRPAHSQAGTTDPSAMAAQAAAGGRLDMSDPKVRERLRASGVDPDELEKLMTTQGAQAVAPVAAPVAPLTSAPVTLPPSAPPVLRDSALAAEVDSTAELKPFGADFFSLKPSTFEPLAFGPVAPDYLIGPGDEIVVTVWGAQELNAKAVVNREGQIVLPDIGQVPANGYTLHNFKESLEKRLSRIYSGISRDGRARTFVDVSLGKLRSIQVFVLGDVVQPGAYTLSATSTAVNALYFAGGTKPTGSMRAVRLNRGNQIVQQVDLYDYLARGQKGQDRRLENGDVVFVPALAHQVTLQGEVRHPALYELRDGETLADLFEFSGGLPATALRSRIQIERMIPANERAPMSQEDRRVLDVRLDADGGSTPLSDGDVVRVFRSRDILKNTVKLVGTAVYRPGTYELRPGMRISDLIDLAGGVLGDAFTGWAHLVRTRDDKTRELVSFNLATALQKDPAADVQLRARDEVQVFSVDDVHDPERVIIQGLVRRTGTYELLKGMTVTDLIMKAGGLQQSAYRVRTEVSRINPGATSDGKMAEVFSVSMGDTLSVDSEASKFRLQHNDIVFVREIPNWSLQENVWLTGEVRFPGLYSLTSKTERLSTLIQRAGGLESTAYLQAGTFVRKKDETGRMAIDFEQALKSAKGKIGKQDLVLAAGDSIHIPREPKAVKVTGEVGFPSSVLWESGRGVDYYIDQAGGTLSTADKGKVSVVMASGRVERPRFMRSPEPDAGAVIRVPRKAEEKDRETLKSMAQIVSILSGAMTTIYLISRTSN